MTLRLDYRVSGDTPCANTERRVTVLLPLRAELLPAPDR